MSAPVLLDLFGCEGLAADGYAAAGWEVWSVDIDRKRARHNPHTWHVGDWSEGLDAALATGRVRAIHASPPCQTYSITRHTHSVEYPDLVAPVRAALVDTGLPWVMENVVGAPLLNPLTLCGAEFGLTADDVDGRPLVLKRHRLFESNVLLYGAGGCACAHYRARGYKVGGVYGGGSDHRDHAEQVRRGGYTPGKAIRAALLGIPVERATLRGQAEGLPPAYTEHIGRQLLAHAATAERAA